MFKLIYSPNSRTQSIWLRLIEFSYQTQWNTIIWRFSLVQFNFFGWVWLVQKSNSHKVRCSIRFDCQIQSNPIHGLSAIEFDFQTFDLLCWVLVTISIAKVSNIEYDAQSFWCTVWGFWCIVWWFWYIVWWAMMLYA